jgi:hypothetical protein
MLAAAPSIGSVPRIMDNPSTLIAIPARLLHNLLCRFEL